MEKKESRNLAVGVKNIQQGDRDFKVRMYLVNESTGARKITGPSDEGISEPAPMDAKTLGSFVYNKGKFNLGVNQDQIMPIKYTAGTATETYVYEIVAYINETDTADYQEYSTKSFFITIV